MTIHQDVASPSYTNSPLVNHLISDTLLDAKPHFNQKPLQFISIQFLTDI